MQPHIQVVLIIWCYYHQLDFHKRIPELRPDKMNLTGDSVGRGKDEWQSSS